jgi:tetratricopeptide (TPR) repeat protein
VRRETLLTSPRAWEVLAAVAAMALYARTVAFGWAFDDQMEIVRNVYVHSFAYLPEIFSTTLWTGSGMETYLYRPLVLVTYALNHAVSGLEAWSYHLVNVLLHAGASVLVFRLGRLWGLQTVAAGIGALLFAVHPVHVEVVANVAGRKDVLASMFVLAMALSHREAMRRGGWRLVIPLGLYACAMLTKEIGAMGLFLVAAQDAYLEDDPKTFYNRPQVIGTYFGYLSILGTFLVARVAVTGVVGVPETFVFDNPLVALGALARVATALVVLGKGVMLLVVPVGLSPDYSFDAIPVVQSAADPRLWAVAAGLGLVAWSVSRADRRPRALTMATAWYALAIVPASNLLITVGTIFGERLLYLPSVAFCLIAGAGVAWLTTRRHTLTLIGVSVWILALGTQTARYSGAWSDDITLFEWATQAVPGSTKAHHKLGEEYLRAGRLGDALRSLDRSLEIAPDNAFAVTTLVVARRNVVERYGATDITSIADPDVLYVLGRSRLGQGDRAGGEHLFEAALARDPAHAESLSDLGAARLESGDTVDAVSYLQRAVGADSSLASAWFNLAGVFLAQGRTMEAGEALRSFVLTGAILYPEQVEWARAMLRRMETEGGADRQD